MDIKLPGLSAFEKGFK